MTLLGFDDPDHQYYLLQVCTLLSYSVLFVTFWYKGPQVYAVVHSGSSLGISMPSLLLEFSSYSIEMTYQIGMGYPLDTYFEIILMWVQDIVLLHVVLDNRHMINLKIVPFLLVYTVLFTSIIRRWLPDILMYIFIGSTTVILFISKSAQLLQIISTKNPGSLSALTWSLLSYLAIARILTTSVVTGDLLMLLNTTTASVLDVAVAVAIIYYNRLKARRILWRRRH